MKMNMRARVMERNRIFYFPKKNKPGYYRCDICGTETNKPSSFINTHVIAHAHARNMQIARRGTIKNLPASTSYLYNGLFCCRDCDEYFEDHLITISGEGFITISPELQPKQLYKKLNGKKVSWSKEISQNVDWPTRETLEFRNTLSPVISQHRYLDFGVDPDDILMASDLPSSTKRKRSTGTDSEDESESEDLEEQEQYMCSSSNARRPKKNDSAMREDFIL
mmetsp:Transcript_28680/g.40904  ORF Transcript_28680/g.40904 Transcript_28680/m.40904 type:complete len:223 (+) Transcript_28680:24-692(+)